MFERYTGKAIQRPSRVKVRRWLKVWLNISAGLKSKAKDRRFFDPREEVAYRANQAKSRLQTRLYQSF